MPTYSREDFERIAAVVGVDPGEVAKHHNSFESAAAWYRSDCRSPVRVPPSTNKRKARLIAVSAKRLRTLLGYGPEAKEPDDWPLLETLAVAGNCSQEDVIRAAERVKRLAAIFDGVDAALELERLGQKAANDAAEIGKLTSLRGRRGKRAVNAWIEAMMPLYKAITGKEPRMSINALGKPTGPFHRFLVAASKPLEIDGKLEFGAVREKTRAIKKRASRQK
jgi:hypothetical protein